MKRTPAQYTAVAAFVAAALAAGVAFGRAALDGESRRDGALLAILRPDYTGDSLGAPDFTLRDREGRTVKRLPTVHRRAQRRHPRV